MTGWLAAMGVVLVLTASAYSGLASSNVAGDAAGTQVTPVTDLEAVEELATPSPTPSPRPTASPTPVLNRLNCQKIKGTDYLSPEERTWYLANCVSR
jgi:hypothetical protein